MYTRYSSILLLLLYFNSILLLVSLGVGQHPSLFRVYVRQGRGPLSNSLAKKLPRPYKTNPFFQTNNKSKNIVESQSKFNIPSVLFCSRAFFFSDQVDCIFLVFGGCLDLLFLFCKFLSYAHLVCLLTVQGSF